MSAKATVLPRRGCSLCGAALPALGVEHAVAGEHGPVHGKGGQVYEVHGQHPVHRAADEFRRDACKIAERDEGQKHLEEYADASTERGQCMLKAICEKFGFHSLGYQSLDGVLEAIGIDRDKICTYCWNGKE